MVVINIFGGPCCGKSTTAAGLFNIMKLKEYNVELLTEYAKKLTWHARHTELNDQFFITASQNHGLEMMRDKVDYVITDSPIILGNLYTPENYFAGFNQLLHEVFASYNNKCFVLSRGEGYTTVGRNQTEAEALDIDNKIREELETNNISYSVIDCDPANMATEIYSQLFEDI